MGKQSNSDTMRGTRSRRKQWVDEERGSSEDSEVPSQASDGGRSDRLGDTFELKRYGRRDRSIR